MDPNDEMELQTWAGTLRDAVDWLRVRLGFSPRCDWVRDRFGEYYGWELDETEFAAVERHLQACPHCAREWRETEPVLKELEALSPLGRQFEALDEEAFMAGLSARIDAWEAEQASSLENSLGARTFSSADATARQTASAPTGSHFHRFRVRLRLMSSSLKNSLGARTSSSADASARQTASAPTASHFHRFRVRLRLMSSSLENSLGARTSSSANATARQTTACSSSPGAPKGGMRDSQVEQSGDSPLGRPAFGRFSWALASRSPRWAMVAVCLLAVSALAYLGPKVWRPLAAHWRSAATLTSGSGAAAPRSKTAEPFGGHGSASGKARAALPAGPLVDNCRCSSLSQDSDLTRQIDQVAAEARVRMLLPQTEAEWEAWARREYPHIMWVYDVLTRPEYGLKWDGQPRYIPEWAQRLWTDPATRPTGWRALVCYSGEILKFDFPESAEAPNVKPTIQAIKRAALIAGYEIWLDGNGCFNLPKLPYGDLDAKRQGGGITLVVVSKEVAGMDWAKVNEFDETMSQVNESHILKYAQSIFSDGPRLTRTVRYVACTSKCMPDPQWKDLAERSTGILELIQMARKMDCDMISLVENSKSLLVAYGKLLVKSLKKVTIKYTLSN